MVYNLLHGLFVFSTNKADKQAIQILIWAKGFSKPSQLFIISMIST